MTDVTDRIARLCILLQDPGAGADFAAAGADGVRQHLVTAMETAAADPELTAALDDLDERMAAADYGHVTRTTRAFRSLPGSRAQQIDVLVCPAPRPCSRVERDPATCALLGGPLRPHRMRS
ncbi:hypothetical protein [Actinoplanes sp. NBRC 103695]|uniref:hypothetical protein n=1 Tax=Actinoplanes sp. NBRC 103695 TaxID=3032202 RepID=UPI0024A46665|nr:hypothetical protein [Actinoplanes sp. NBRC 103695]GLY94454.1 hypothetical protein Acsp02_17100 [Actinoplanes sp. NBRC 103695]